VSNHNQKFHGKGREAHINAQQALRIMHMADTVYIIMPLL
jgi:hypothetical protein